MDPQIASLCTAPSLLTYSHVRIWLGLQQGFGLELSKVKGVKELGNDVLKIVKSKS